MLRRTVAVLDKISPASNFLVSCLAYRRQVHAAMRETVEEVGLQIFEKESQYNTTAYFRNNARSPEERPSSICRCLQIDQAAY